MVAVTPNRTRETLQGSFACPPVFFPLRLCAFVFSCLLVSLNSCTSRPFSKLPPPPVPSADHAVSVSLRLVTYNIYGIPYFTKNHHERVAAIARLVGAKHADVAAFQEAFDATDRQLLCESLAKAGLPYHHYFRSGVFGSGLLTVSRYPISDTAFHRYSQGGNPLALQHHDWWAGKGAGRVTVDIPGFGNMRIINTHLHARYHGDHYNVLRQSQLDELMAFLAVNLSANDPVLLLGDLNHRLDDPGWLRCIQTTGLIPLAEQHSPIDYIMAVQSPNFSFEQGRSEPLKGTLQCPDGDIPISDHTGVLTTARIMTR